MRPALLFAMHGLAFVGPASGSLLDFPSKYFLWRSTCACNVYWPVSDSQWSARPSIGGPEFPTTKNSQTSLALDQSWQGDILHFLPSEERQPLCFVFARNSLNCLIRVLNQGAIESSGNCLYDSTTTLWRLRSQFLFFVVKISSFFQ